MPEGEVIKAFNKRFPFVKVEMVRAPGGQLITRIKTEAAAGKLLADVVNHSDRGLMQSISDLFQDYAPPNAKDYREDQPQRSSNSAYGARRLALAGATRAHAASR